MSHYKPGKHSGKMPLIYFSSIPFVFFGIIYTFVSTIMNFSGNISYFTAPDFSIPAAFSVSIIITTTTTTP